MRRYVVDKGYGKLGLRDFSVWNEPDGANNTAYSFWCKGPDEYADLYAAVYLAVKGDPEVGSRVRVGVALGSGGAFSYQVLRNLHARSARCRRHGAGPTNGTQQARGATKPAAANGTVARVGIDFVDHHFYVPQPYLMVKETHAGPNGSTLEGMLADTGWPKDTPLVIGEWSRSIGQDYAQDVPGAAFLACGLVHLNGMGKHNSRGLHNIEQVFVYAAGKVWAGEGGACTDLNAAMLWNVWSKMAVGELLEPKVASTPRMLDVVLKLAKPPPQSQAPTDELCALAGTAEATTKAAPAINVLLGHYRGTSGTSSPSILSPFALTVDITSLPWGSTGRWTWEHYVNEVSSE
jgi:hypothetical protein